MSTNPAKAYQQFKKPAQGNSFVIAQGKSANKCKKGCRCKRFKQ